MTRTTPHRAGRAGVRCDCPLRLPFEPCLGLQRCCRKSACFRKGVQARPTGTEAEALVTLTGTLFGMTKFLSS